MGTRGLGLVAMVLMSLVVTVPDALAEEPCPNAASRQGPSAGLPDCRAYEQVTPVNKGDSPDLFPSLEGTVGQNSEDYGYVAEDGEHFLLNTPADFLGGDAFKSSYVFSRSAEGWTTTAISPGPGTLEVEATVFSADLSEVGFEDDQLNGQPEEYLQGQVIGPPGGPYTALSALSPLEAEGANSKSEYMGASAGLSHVVLQTAAHKLRLGDEAEERVDEGRDSEIPALYESLGGNLRLVDVTTNGSLVSPCGALLGNGSENGGAQNAVSSDGSKIFFTAPDSSKLANEGEIEGRPGCRKITNGKNENPAQVYMRLNDTTTVDVSAPNPGVHDPDGPQQAVYVGASADGSEVFFITKTELTSNDTTHALELYEYNTEAPEGERLVRVSSGDLPSGPAEGNVDFVAAVANNGSAVYFAAFGKLAEGATAREEKEELVNLYRYETATGRTTYITTVKSNDYPAKEKEEPTSYSDSTEIPLGTPRPNEITPLAETGWYATANGQYLLFSSDLPLAGFNNTQAPGAQCENLYPGGVAQPSTCVELFRYSAVDNSIVCVSCAGGAPVDDAEFGLRDTFRQPSVGPRRPISEDGSYVFFETRNALVPQTTDTHLHVYEWHDGTISLISSADDPADAYFQGSSADGSNVFFGTHAQLVPQDTDFNGDLYDARIDGGFVGLTPPLCTGTGCQGVPAAPPIFATPSSVTFEGLGNFPSSPGTSVKAKAKALTRAQKLARALKVCKRDRNKRKRVGCRASARKKYGATAKPSKSNRGGK